jgi:ATP-dependent helicase/nuclease subunit B
VSVLGLRIIYGRAGTGKSDFCFEEIKAKIDQQEKVYIIVPEQFSFTTEKKLLDKLDKQSTLNAEVITFHRMANRIFNEIGSMQKELLSKNGRTMLMYKILNDQKKNLKFLGKSNENIDLMIKTIKEFKKHNVSIDRLENTINQIEDEYLKLKLKDIDMIYRNF